MHRGPRPAGPLLAGSPEGAPQNKSSNLCRRNTSVRAGKVEGRWRGSEGRGMVIQHAGKLPIFVGVRHCGGGVFLDPNLFVTALTKTSATSLLPHCAIARAGVQAGWVRDAGTGPTTHWSRKGTSKAQARAQAQLLGRPTAWDWFLSGPAAP